MFFIKPAREIGATKVRRQRVYQWLLKTFTIKTGVFSVAMVGKKHILRTCQLRIVNLNMTVLFIFFFTNTIFKFIKDAFSCHLLAFFSLLLQIVLSGKPEVRLMVQHEPAGLRKP
jgi:hypothetical protein